MDLNSMKIHRLRLAGREYLLFNTQRRAPPNGRKLGARELEGLLEAHRNEPRLTSLLACFRERRLERYRHLEARGSRRGGAARWYPDVICYELPRQP
ncbi:hypothetical protein, partial [Enhygromyxa salina]|uniref:hypothetical protein n=1 Tax=Enhygromyxa salina TaxID=215803 RepID=UPI0011B1CE3C